MEQPGLDENLVRKYLLGQLPKRELERFEAGLLLDDQYYETLTALEDEVEDELIDEYLNGELTDPEREHFERIFLKIPERAHKLKVIKALKEQAVGTPEPVYAVKWTPLAAVFQNPIVGLSMAAALLLAMLCCLWLAIRSNRLENQLRFAQSQGQSEDAALKQQLDQMGKNNEELTAKLRASEEQLAALKERGTQTPTSTFASVILFSSRRSGSQGISTLHLTPGTTEARLTLNVEDVDPKDYKRFRAVVKKRSGAEVWRSENVRLQTRGTRARTTLTLPIKSLPEGEYTVDLDGETNDNQFEPVALYSFRVAK
jgi:hypothetical protein